MGWDGGEKVNTVTLILHRMPDAQKGKETMERDYETLSHVVLPES